MENNIENKKPTDWKTGLTVAGFTIGGVIGGLLFGDPLVFGLVAFGFGISAWLGQLIVVPEWGEHGYQLKVGSHIFAAIVGNITMLSALLNPDDYPASMSISIVIVLTGLVAGVMGTETKLKKQQTL